MVKHNERLGLYQVPISREGDLIQFQTSIDSFHMVNGASLMFLSTISNLVYYGHHGI